MAAMLPQPEPAWFDEVRTFDYRRALVASSQVSTWVIASIMEEYTAVHPHTTGVARVRDHARAPYLHLSRRDFVEHQRLTTIALLKGEAPPEVAWWNEPAKMAAPNVVDAWKRLGELEARVGR